VVNKRHFLRSTVYYWAPVILYAGIIFGLSSVSAVPEMPKNSDKILHFIEYFLFAFLLWRAFARERTWSLETGRFIIIALIGSLYAASDEIHQSYVPGRYASIYDWFTDVAGILGMLTLMVIRLKWRGSGRQSYETI
jgi:VanZ family protein